MGAILGLIPAIVVAIILFIVNPIFGALWVLWLVGAVIYVFRKDRIKALLMKFLGWLFGANKYK